MKKSLCVLWAGVSYGPENTVYIFEDITHFIKRFHATTNTFKT